MTRRWWFIISAVAIIALVVVIGSGFGIEQKRQRAGLQINTSDASATAYLNDVYLDRSPLVEKNLRPGIYTLRLVADDTKMAAFEQQVTLHAGTLTTVTWKPAVKPEYASSITLELVEIDQHPDWQFWRQPTDTATGALTIKSIPDNAIIALAADSNRQFAPFAYDQLAPGSLEYTVSLPSFETHQHTIKIQPGYQTIATVKLAKNTPDAFAELAEENADVLGVSTASAQLAKLQAATSSATISGTFVRVNPTGYQENEQEVLKVRQAASTSATQIGTVAVGTTLPYEGEQQGDWYKILFNGSAGWVSKTFTTLATASATATSSTKVRSH